MISPYVVFSVSLSFAIIKDPTSIFIFICFALVFLLIIVTTGSLVFDLEGGVISICGYKQRLHCWIFLYVKIDPQK